MKNKKEPHDQAGAYIDVRDCLIVWLCHSYSLNQAILLAVFAIGHLTATLFRARFRCFARFGFVAMTCAAAFCLFGFGFCHKFLLLGLFARILFILAD